MSSRSAGGAARIPSAILRIALALALVAGGGLIASLLGSGSPSQAADSSYSTKLHLNGTVTVDQTKDLVAQRVRVSWSGLPPTADDIKIIETAYRTVLIVQCWGTDPATPQQCYGAGEVVPIRRDGMSAGGKFADGPWNSVLTRTLPNGTGTADVEIRTKAESTVLGCNAAQPCSLVVIPLISSNGEFGNLGQWNVSPSGDIENNPIAKYAWSNRAVIPLTFAPEVAALCGTGDPDVTFSGAPLSRRAMASWLPAACAGAGSVVGDFTDNSEPEGRNYFLQDLRDVGVGTRPIPEGDSRRAYTYAPVSTTALSVVVIADDRYTFQEIPRIRLNARLVAKMITQSYRSFLASCTEVGPNPRVPATAPFDLLADPEFQALNRQGSFYITSGSPIQMFAENSDMMWELTRWVISDPDAREFLSGQPDPWGMVVNQAFKGVQGEWPTEIPELRDDHPFWLKDYQPVKMRQLGLNLVANFETKLTRLIDNDPSPICAEYPKKPADNGESPGARTLVGFLDYGTAAAYRLPTAALLNNQGKYVSPSQDSMAAAVSQMTTNPDGITQAANFAGSSPDAYPLTMVQYAAVPTGDVSDKKADDIAALLEFIANRGQTPGINIGQLPPGYAPLTEQQKAQTLAAATAVRNQTGKPSPSPTPSSSPTQDEDSPDDDDTPDRNDVDEPDDDTGTGSDTNDNDNNGSSSPSTSTSPTPAAGTSPSTAPGTSAGNPVPSPSPSNVAAVGTTSGLTMGTIRWALAIVLGLGAVAAVGATVLTLVSRPDNPLFRQIRSVLPSR